MSAGWYQGLTTTLALFTKRACLSVASGVALGSINSCGLGDEAEGQTASIPLCSVSSLQSLFRLAIPDAERKVPG